MEDHVSFVSNKKDAAEPKIISDGEVANSLQPSPSLRPVIFTLHFLSDASDISSAAMLVPSSMYLEKKSSGIIYKQTNESMNVL